MFPSVSDGMSFHLLLVNHPRMGKQIFSLVGMLLGLLNKYPVEHK